MLQPQCWPSGGAHVCPVNCWRSPCLPGQLLGEPGPPLSNLQTKALLEELYKLDNKPAIQTSATVNPIDISFTDRITHVYVKVDEPRGLCPRFEGPYKVMSRPSRSQVEVRVGSYANGDPRLVTFHWSSCKPAHMREDAEEGSRPNIGRRPNPTTPNASLTSKQTAPVDDVVANYHETSNTECRQLSSEAAKRGKFKRGQVHSSDADVSSGSVPHPDYIKKGPVITREMYDKWTPDLLGIPSSTRPVRSSRNPAPNYVD